MTVVATGLSHGGRADSTHAVEAVRIALERANLTRANGLFVFLTHEYAADPEPALRAAARAAGSMQVIGCTGTGLLTEDEWLLDSPGAAVMVFGGDLQLDPVCDHDDDAESIISLCTPAGLNSDWLDIPAPRIGAVSGDPFGQGPFTVWSGSRVAESGHVEVRVRGTRSAVTVSQGVRALTAPIKVAEVEGHDLVRLGNYPALNVLVRSLPESVRQKKRIPLHMTAISEGRYRLNHIISANLSKQSITLSDQLNPGESLFWAMRDTLAAEREMKQTVKHAKQQLGDSPDFALLFPCMGRGPNFYGNRDRDLEILQAAHPNLPTIGFYGNGEIGPLDAENYLYQYSTVLGLYKINQ
jgi:small ligand-binding sensory domain FIST